MSKFCSFSVGDQWSGLSVQQSEQILFVFHNVFFFTLANLFKYLIVSDDSKATVKKL